MNSHDIWKEKRQVEKSILEIAGKSGDRDLADLMIELLNKDQQSLERNEDEYYKLEDLDDADTHKATARLAHAYFMGSMPIDEEVNNHIEYSALGAEAERQITEGMKILKDQLSQLRNIALQGNGVKERKRESKVIGTFANKRAKKQGAKKK